MTQCWAYNRDGKRCEKDASHTLSEADALHGFVVEWTDEECFDPTAVPASGPTRRSVRRVPIEDVTGPDDFGDPDDEPRPGRCFSCGCPAAAHGEDGCAAHACRTFVP